MGGRLERLEGHALHRDQPLGHDVGVVVGQLQRALHGQHRRRTHLQALPLVEIGVDHDVDQPELVFQQQEGDALGRAGPLPADDQAGNLHPVTIRQGGQVMCRNHVLRQARSHELKRMVER